jgi:hypothetical protein
MNINTPMYTHTHRTNGHDSKYARQCTKNLNCPTQECLVFRGYAVRDAAATQFLRDEATNPETPCFFLPYFVGIGPTINTANSGKKEAVVNMCSTKQLSRQKERKTHKRLEVLTAKMSMFVLWVVTPCAPVGRYQLFGGTYRHHLQP